MAGTGGARPGAGRKPKKEKYAGPINRAEKLIVDKLQDLVKTQLKLADGGFEIVEEEWEPAGKVMTGSGRYAMKTFPDLPGDQLVCVKRRVSIAAPDRAAGQYLIDRIAGKPVQKIQDEDAQDKISMYGQLIQELRKDRDLLEPDEQAESDLTGNGAI